MPGGRPNAACSIKEALNKSVPDFSERGWQETWFLPTSREQWLTPLFAAARPCAAGTSELVQSFLYWDGPTTTACIQQQVSKHERNCGR
jgi:hypothetical protein